MNRCPCCFSEYDEEIAMGVCPNCGYTEFYRPKDPRFLPLGTMIHDRYVVGGVLGDGGFGITYYAWDTVLRTVVALKEYFQRGVVNREPGKTKVFIAAPGREEEFNYGKERLLREAQIVSKFQSAPIVRVNDYFEENATSYMVMEYIDYTTLTDTLQENKKVLTPEQVIQIGSQLCDALEEIHNADVLHRDIAPDNIFINAEGKVKVIDFGSARLSKEDTLERLILVKEGFSPVEQYEVINVNENLQQAWTDVYALGATLYYCVTGVRPEESRIRKTNVDNGLSDIQEPKELNPNVSENLNNTIMKAMAINSHERFKSATEMKKALQGDIQVQPLRVIRRRKRMIRAASIAAALVVIGVVMVETLVVGNKQYDDITLDAASVSVWYPAATDEIIDIKYDKTTNGWVAVDGSDLDIPEDILLPVIEQEAASAQFNEIDLTVKMIPLSEYDDIIEEADRTDTMPSLFKNNEADLKVFDHAEDVSDIAKNLNSDARDCNFMKDNVSLFKEKKAIPTGFEIPVLYINTTIVSDLAGDSKISSMEDLLKLANGDMKYKPIAVEEEAAYLYEKTFSDYTDVISKLTLTDKEAFLNGKAAAYLATSKEYTDVKTALPVMYAIRIPDSKKIACEFKDYWSVGTSDEAEFNAAEVLVSYLFTEHSQDQLYSRMDSEALPVNKTALNRYVDVYDQLADIAEKTDNCVFDK